jgi:uncharacterized protein
MGPVLKGLIELQSVESKLRGLRARLTRFKKAVVIQQQALKELELRRDEHKEKIQDTKIDIDRLELELKSRDETVTKYKEALNKAKSNKEYAAILTELNTNKADNSKVESRILEYMEVIEQQKSSCEQLSTDIDKQKQTIEEVSVKAADKIAECEQAITEVEGSWKELAANLPDDVLQLFEKLSDMYDGQAVAQVQQADGRQASYSCGGCFMSVTAETISLLIAKDEISQCKNCGRILVMEQSQSGQ